MAIESHFLFIAISHPHEKSPLSERKVPSFLGLIMPFSVT